MARVAERGVTLVEMIVVMAIVAMLVMMAAPSLSRWVINARIRTTAEAMESGLQLAKSEAVARNTRVRFQLTSTLDNSCVASVNGANWVVNLDPNADPTEVEGACDSAPSDADAPFILQTRPAAAGSGSLPAAVVTPAASPLSPAPAPKPPTEAPIAPSEKAPPAAGTTPAPAQAVPPPSSK